MSRDDLHFRLRIPEGLKSQVEAAARENHRSMTAEIIARLEGSFTSMSRDQVDKFTSFAMNKYAHDFVAFLASKHPDASMREASEVADKLLKPAFAPTPPDAPEE